MSSQITTEWDSYTTFICSTLSIVGSILVIFSYVVAKSNSSPHAAELIRNLAIADFLWFSAAVTESSYWIFTDEDVPKILCYSLSPIVNFMRMASLLWTTAISFDVLMSVNKRKWGWSSNAESWQHYRRIYYVVILVFALPGATLNAIKQHSNHSDLGCNPGYEKIGEWYDVFFTELLPISIGFMANVYVYLQVREKMGQNAFPQSVRKRRRRIMYHYILVCIICWTPTIVFYLSEISGLHSAELEIIARASLYLTGFFNFLVFGMQDPHLRRSFLHIMKKVSCCCPEYINNFESSLLHREVDKTVMFGGHIEENADVAKDKKNIYRYHKLTADDKAALYSNRPDLDPKVIIGSRNSDSRKPRIKNNSVDIAAVKNASNMGFDDSDEEDYESISGLNAPLLTDQEREHYEEVNGINSNINADDVMSAVLQEASPVDAANCDGSDNCEEMMSFNNENTLNNDATFDNSNKSRESDVIVNDEENRGATHVKLSVTDRKNIGGLDSSPVSFRSNSASADGPMVCDEEMMTRTSDGVKTVRNTSSERYSVTATLHNTKTDSDSSGDEADEEDHELAERLSSSSFLLRSP